MGIGGGVPVGGELGAAGGGVFVGAEAIPDFGGWGRGRPIYIYVCVIPIPGKGFLNVGG